MGWEPQHDGEGRVVGWIRDDGLELVEENFGKAPPIRQPKRDRLGHAWVWCLQRDGETIHYFTTAAAGKRWAKRSAA